MDLDLHDSCRAKTQIFYLSPDVAATILNRIGVLGLRPINGILEFLRRLLSGIPAFSNRLASFVSTLLHIGFDLLSTVPHSILRYGAKVLGLSLHRGKLITHKVGLKLNYLTPIFGLNNFQREIEGGV